MLSTNPFRWYRLYICTLSYYYQHHRFRSISFFHCCQNCPWLCADHIMLSRLLYIYSGIAGFAATTQFMVCGNDSIHYEPMLVSFVGHLRHIIMIIMRRCLKALNIRNACHAYSVECVSKMRSILAIIFYVIYGAVCHRMTKFIFDDCGNMCISLYHHHRNGNMIH